MYAHFPKSSIMGNLILSDDISSDKIIVERDIYAQQIKL
jgi:hypothetical protein